MLTEDFRHSPRTLLIHAQLPQRVDTKIEGAAEGFAIDLVYPKTNYFVGMLSARGPSENLEVWKLVLDHFDNLERLRFVVDRQDEKLRPFRPAAWRGRAATRRRRMISSRNGQRFD